MLYIVIAGFVLALAAIMGAALYLEGKKIQTKAEKPGPRRPLNMGDLNNVQARSPLSERERRMYLELTAALPGCIVLAQVALSSLLDTPSKATRVRIDRKVADFVICSKTLDVLAVVELNTTSDDKLRLIQDADRDTMIGNAGYQNIRYNGVPDQATIRKDIAALIVANKPGNSPGNSPANTSANSSTNSSANSSTNSSANTVS